MGDIRTVSLRPFEECGLPTHRDLLSEWPPDEARAFAVTAFRSRCIPHGTVTDAEPGSAAFLLEKFSPMNTANLHGQSQTVVILL